MQKYMLAILLAMLMGLSACDDNTANDESSGGINLENELSTIGNVVELQSNDSIVQAKVTDDDDDNVADGLDLSGSGASDLVYVDGAFSVKTLVRDVSSVGFYAVGNEDEVYYFGADANAIVITTEADGGGNEVVFVVEGGTILGLDTTGDGTADDTTLSGIQIVVFESSIDEYYFGEWAKDDALVSLNELTYSENPSDGGDPFTAPVEAVLEESDQIIIMLNDGYIRVNFQQDNDEIYACGEGGFASFEEARDATTPNPDIATGCNGDGWKILTPATLDISGNYVDEYNGDQLVSATKWVTAYSGSSPSTFHTHMINNDSDYLIASNNQNNQFNPGKFSRFHWVTIGQSIYYCQEVTDADDFSTAQSAPFPDDSNPSIDGCGTLDSAWTLLNP